MAKDILITPGANDPKIEFTGSGVGSEATTLKVNSDSTLTIGDSGADFLYIGDNVGVGTTSPSEKLHVVGNVLATGDVSATTISSPTITNLQASATDADNRLDTAETTISQIEGDINTLEASATDHESRIASLEGGSDHGGLTGLADDDHTQYLLADGTRQISGNLSSVLTWNSGQTETAYTIKVTDTSSTTSSLLLKGTVDDYEVLSLAKDGDITIQKKGVVYSDHLTLTLQGATGTYGIGSQIYLKNYLNDSMLIKMYAGERVASISSGGNTHWWRPNTGLEMRNAGGALSLMHATATSPAKTYIYNTYTNDSNYERLKIGWDSNILKLEAENAGTGSARDLGIYVSGNPKVYVKSNGYVGIGTSSPTSDLQIGTNTSVPPDRWLTITGYDNFGIKFISHGGWSNYQFIGRNNGSFTLKNIGTNNVNTNFQLEANSSRTASIGIYQPNYFVNGQSFFFLTMHPTYKSIDFISEGSGYTAANLIIKTRYGAGTDDTRRYVFRNTGYFESSGIKALNSSFTNTFAGPITCDLDITANSISVSALNATVTGHTGDSTIHFTEASIDHGSIAGLADDDHTQYVTKSPSTTARNTIQPSDDVPGLTIQAGLSNTSGLLSITDSTTAEVFRVNYTGSVEIPRTQYYGVRHLGTFTGLMGLNSANSRTFGDLTSNTGKRVIVGNDGSITFGTNNNSVIFANGALNTEVARVTGDGSWQDADNILHIKNSTNPQTLNLYNTYTDASNYERLSIGWESNVLNIRNQQAGTGSARSIAINPATKFLGVNGTPDSNVHFHLRGPTDNSCIFLVESMQSGGEWVRFSAGTTGSAMKYSNTGFFGIVPVASKTDTSTFPSAFFMDSTGKIALNATATSEILNVNGNIAVTGTVDGRDVAADGTALDNHIASGSVHFTEASIDHGSIAGLGDNDHPQYVLSSTNNALSSTVSNLQTSATEADKRSQVIWDHLLPHDQNGNWNANTINGGNAYQQNQGGAGAWMYADTSVQGVMTVTNGNSTATNSGATKYHTNFSTYLNVDTIYYFRVATGHSTDVCIRFGVTNDSIAATATPQIGAYAQVDTSVGSNIYLVTADDNVRTETDTGLSVTSINQAFRWFAIRVEDAGGGARAVGLYDVEGGGTLLAKNTTNIPDAASDSGMRAFIQCIGRGSTFRACYLDTFGVYMPGWVPPNWLH